MEEESSAINDTPKEGEGTFSEGEATVNIEPGGGLLFSEDAKNLNANVEEPSETNITCADQENAEDSSLLDYAEQKSQDPSVAEEMSSQLDCTEQESQDPSITEEMSSQLDYVEQKSQDPSVAEEMSSQLNYTEQESQDPSVAEEMSSQLDYTKQAAQDPGVAEEMSSQLDYMEQKSQDASVAEEMSSQLDYMEQKSQDPSVAEGMSSQLDYIEQESQDPSVAEEMSTIKSDGDYSMDVMSDSQQETKEDISAQIESLLKDTNPESLARSIYACPLCDKVFRNKSGRYNHIKKRHNVRLDFGKVQCLEKGCKFSCTYTRALQKHLTETHKIPMEYCNYKFNSKEEFQKWKDQYEKKEMCRFVKRSGTKMSHREFSGYLYCNRTGVFVSRSKGMKRMKQAGSTKMSAHCTASIKYVVEGDGKVTVQLCSTHYGHEKDYRYLRLTESDRKIILDKMKQGIPADILLDTVRSSCSDQVDRLHIISRKDIMNIQKVHKIRMMHSETGRKSQVTRDMDKWVEKVHSCGKDNPVLYYKKKDAIESSSGLSIEDECVILMTSGQRDIFTKLAENGILYTSVFRLLYLGNFYLIVLFAVDEFKCTFPVACTITNRCDEKVFELFFKRVLEKRKVQVRTFVTDNAGYIFEMWQKVSGESPHHVWSNRYVDEEWRDYLSVIQDEKLQFEVYDKIYKFIESDDDECRSQLPEVVEEIYSDPKCTAFGEYLKAYFLDYSPMWATCYTKNATAFHGPINFDASCEKIKDSIDSLNGVRLFKYLSCYTQQLIKLILDFQIDRKSKLSVQENILNTTHNQNTINDVQNVFPLADGVWKVASPSTSSEADEAETVVRGTCIFVDCAVRCSKCGVCGHALRCSCERYSTTYACKHIHLVWSLQNQKLQQDDGTEMFPSLFSSESVDVDTDIKENSYQSDTETESALVRNDYSAFGEGANQEESTSEYFEEKEEVGYETRSTRKKSTRGARVQRMPREQKTATSAERGKKRSETEELVIKSNLKNTAMSEINLAKKLILKLTQSDVLHEVVKLAAEFRNLVATLSEEDKKVTYGSPHNTGRYNTRNRKSNEIVQELDYETIEMPIRRSKRGRPKSKTNIVEIPEELYTNEDSGEEELFCGWETEENETPLYETTADFVVGTNSKIKRTYLKSDRSLVLNQEDEQTESNIDKENELDLQQNEPDIGVQKPADSEGESIADIKNAIEEMMLDKNHQRTEPRELKSDVSNQVNIEESYVSELSDQYKTNIGTESCVSQLSDQHETNTDGISTAEETKNVSEAEKELGQLQGTLEPNDDIHSELKSEKVIPSYDIGTDDAVLSENSNDSFIMLNDTEIPDDEKETKQRKNSGKCTSLKNLCTSDNVTINDNTSVIDYSTGSEERINKEQTSELRDENAPLMEEEQVSNIKMDQLMDVHLICEPSTSGYHHDNRKVEEKYLLESGPSMKLERNSDIPSIDALTSVGLLAKSSEPKIETPVSSSSTMVCLNKNNTEIEEGQKSDQKGPVFCSTAEDWRRPPPLIPLRTYSKRKSRLEVDLDWSDVEDNEDSSSDISEPENTYSRRTKQKIISRSYLTSKKPKFDVSRLE